MTNTVDDGADYMEPTGSGRRALVLMAALSAVLLVTAKLWLVPAFTAHVRALPPCEQREYMVNTIQAIFLAAPLLLSAFMVPMAVRMLRHRRFPLSGAWIWRRRKIQRGRIVVARACLIIALCLLMFAFPFWVRQTLAKASIQDPCASQP